MTPDICPIENEYSLETKKFGFWAFLAMETMFFGAIFFLYINERFFYPDAFRFGSHLLNLKLGTLNTAVLLTSSLSMALAQFYLRQNDKRNTLIYLALTLLLGCAFLWIKAIEIGNDYSHSLIPGFRFVQLENAPAQHALFQGLYLFAISVHALHLAIGILWVLGLSFFLAKGTAVFTWLARGETLGLYWHFVDIVWIFLFPLFYLAGGPQ